MPSTLILVALMDAAPPTTWGPQASPGPLWGTLGRWCRHEDSGVTPPPLTLLPLPTDLLSGRRESEAAMGMRREAQTPWTGKSGAAARTAGSAGFQFHPGPSVLLRHGTLPGGSHGVHSPRCPPIPATGPSRPPGTGQSPPNTYPTSRPRCHGRAHGQRWVRHHLPHPVLS